MADTKLSAEQKKYFDQIVAIWESEGYKLTQEDKIALENIAKSGNADAEIKKLLQKKDKKWF